MPARHLALLGVALLFAMVLPAEAQIGFRQLTSTYPVAVQRGTSAEVKLLANFTLDETYAVLVEPPGVTFTYGETEPIEAPLRRRGNPGTPFRFHVQVPEVQAPGVYEYRVATKQAVSSVAQVMVTDYPVVLEEEKENGTPDAAQPVSWPAAVCGVCEKDEDVDCYRISGQAGQELVIEIFAQRVTDKIHDFVVKGPRIYLMDSLLTLIGPNGQVVAENDNFHGGDSLLACRLPVDGDYTLLVRDARYAGDPRYTYCVEISDRPYVHLTYPMAVQQGAAVDVEPVGHGLADVKSLPLAASEIPPGWTQLRLATPRGETNPVAVLVSPHPQILEAEPNNTLETATPITFPVGVNGRLDQAFDADTYRFEAKKGQRYHFELEAHRRGSPLDGLLELYDDKGKLLAEADDLPQHFTKDSRLLWQAPADGVYFVVVRDLRDHHGPRFVYHLRCDLAEPDFELSGEYYYAMLSPGVRAMWFAKIERLNGFEGPVQIEIENLPPGVTCTPVTIPAGMNHCGLILSAADDAEINASLARVIGRAKVASSDGQEREIVRRGRVTCEQQSSGGGQARWPINTQIVGVTKPLDLKAVVAAPEEIVLTPGQTAEIAVRVERTEGFDDAVTLAMSFDYTSQKYGEQLPPGVIVSPKSQLRVTGKTAEGKIVLEATDKAVPVERLPIAALARVAITFSITTNYASNPVYLTVKAKE